MESVSLVQAALERGFATFCDHEILVERGVLVPRKESEVLVSVPRALFARDRDLIVIDMGTGAGNVAIALAHAFPNGHVHASDVSAQATKLATRNVEKHALVDRVHTYTGDLFAPLDALELERRVHLITSSPPFISSKRLEGARSELLDLEPREAFDAGPYGMRIHQRLVRDGARYLASGGYLVVEFGRGQADQVARLALRANAYDEVRFFEGPVGFVNAMAARRGA